MSKTTLRAGAAASAFAHLLGLQARPLAAGPAAAAPDDDEMRASQRAEEDDRRKDEDARRAEEDDRRRDEDARRAEEDGSGAGDEDDKDKEGKKGKRAKASDDEQCDEEKDDDDAKASAARAGRAFERARCAAIFTSEAAGKRPDVAAHLAFTTGMSAAAAVALLETTAAGGPVAAPVATRRTLDDRMASVHTPNPGPAGGAAPTGASGLALAIVAAGKKRRGEA